MALNSQLQLHAWEEAAVPAEQMCQQIHRVGLGAHLTALYEDGSQV